MKTLIVYYSRTGFTRQVALEMAKILGADCEEITEDLNRGGIKGYLISGREALKRCIPEIKEIKSDIANYDVVVLGTPVWVGTMSSPMRSFLAKYKDKLSRVALFSTQGSSKRQKVFDEMSKLIYGEPLAELFITTRQVKQSAYRSSVDKFIQEISQAR